LEQNKIFAKAEFRKVKIKKIVEIDAVRGDEASDLFRTGFMNSIVHDDFVNSKSKLPTDSLSMASISSQQNLLEILKKMDDQDSVVLKQQPKKLYNDYHSTHLLRKTNNCKIPTKKLQGLIKEVQRTSKHQANNGNNKVSEIKVIHMNQMKRPDSRNSQLKNAQTVHADLLCSSTKCGPGPRIVTPLGSYLYRISQSKMSVKGKESHDTYFKEQCLTKANNQGQITNRASSKPLQSSRNAGLLSAQGSYKNLQTIGNYFNIQLSKKHENQASDRDTMSSLGSYSTHNSSLKKSIPRQQAAQQKLNVININDNLRSISALKTAVNLKQKTKNAQINIVSKYLTLTHRGSHNIPGKDIKNLVSFS
jgi:hypothetical protein